VTVPEGWQDILDKDENILWRGRPDPRVTFASTTRRGKSGTYLVPVGFERIADARDVFHKMVDIQRAAA